MFHIALLKNLKIYKVHNSKNTVTIAILAEFSLETLYFVNFSIEIVKAINRCNKLICMYLTFLLSSQVLQVMVNRRTFYYSVNSQLIQFNCNKTKTCNNFMKCVFEELKCRVYSMLTVILVRKK